MHGRLRSRWWLGKSVCLLRLSFLGTCHRSDEPCHPRSRRKRANDGPQNALVDNCIKRSVLASTPGVPFCKHYSAAGYDLIRVPREGGTFPPCYVMSTMWRNDDIGAGISGFFGNNSCAKMFSVPITQVIAKPEQMTWFDCLTFHANVKLGNHAVSTYLVVHHSDRGARQDYPI